MKRVLIIGGGPAGMQAALSLEKAGLKPVIFEKSDSLGGKLRDWHVLFPSMAPASEVLESFTDEIAAAGIEVRLNEEPSELPRDGTPVIVATGFEVFDARLKEEYGYGIYRGVLTTVDVERMLASGGLHLENGVEPRRVAFVHCVGSRDEKVDQRHCSKVCCITGVKQAMELAAMFPEAEVFNFYMDIRMFGPGYEELYQRAQQESGVNFIRGRVSEASPTFDGRIQIKAEDTLVGRPMKMTVDLLVLAVGMCGTAPGGGFYRPRDLFRGSVLSDRPNVFYAGAATAPKTIGESIAEGIMAAERVIEYLRDGN